MVIAAEAYLDSLTALSAGTNQCALLANYNQYLSELGTQPVTVPIRSLVDGMVDAFMDCRGASPEFESFAWPRSPAFKVELEHFIFTRECWFYHPEWMPAVKATFQTTRFHSSQAEMPITVHYAWNPPTIDFVDLQNVFQEHRPVVLAPTLSHMDSHPRSGDNAIKTGYETDLPSHIGWNTMTRRLEGKWPSSLAGTAGAERLESFTLPLGVAATLISSFPGDVKLERVLRVAVPVTIKRKADDCSTLPAMVPSPASSVHFGVASSHATAQLSKKLRRLSRRDSGVSIPAPNTSLSVHTMWNDGVPGRTSAAHVASSTTTPTVSPRASTAKQQLSPISYKELTDLLALKAKQGHATSPLELNPLSMAQIWDATAPSPNHRDIQCWGVSVENNSPDDKGLARLRALADLCTLSAISGALSLDGADDQSGDEADYLLSRTDSATEVEKDADFEVYSDDADGKACPNNAKRVKVSQVPRRLPFRCISGNEQVATLKHEHSTLAPVETCKACKAIREDSDAVGHDGTVEQSDGQSDTASLTDISKRRDSREFISSHGLEQIKKAMKGMIDKKAENDKRTENDKKTENDRKSVRIPSDVPAALLESIWAEDSDWETYPCNSPEQNHFLVEVQPVRPRRLENWRAEPERLNEAEVDELQRAIQASYLECEGREKEVQKVESPIDGYESGDEADFRE